VTTKCPKCGRDVPGMEDCVCGCRARWIAWCQSVHDLGIARGWQELKCPNGVSVFVHPDEDCEHPECRFYPIRHRHRVDDIEEIVIVEEDKPGATNRT